jgi:hypothetical protein
MSATIPRPFQKKQLWADWWPFGLLVVSTFALRAPWFGNPNADIDEQLYSLIGSAMLDGKLPFVDIWDRKPVGLFALFALAHAAGGPTTEAYQLLAGLFVFGGGLITYRLASGLVDLVTSAGAALLVVILMTRCGAHSANAEAFFIPIMLAMVLLVCDHSHPRARIRALSAMLLGGIALQVKYTVLPQCLFLGMWALWGEYRRGTPWVHIVGLAAAFGALGTLPTAFVAIAYAIAGHFDAFVFANFVSFFARAPGGRLDPQVAAALGIPLALAIGGLYAAWRFNPPPDRQRYFLFVGWFGASLGTVVLPGTVYVYYTAAVVPAAVLTGLPFLDRRGLGRLLPLALVIISSIISLLARGGVASQAKERADMYHLAKSIAPFVGERERCLFVFDGPTSLYRLTGSCLPTRFVYPDHLNNAFEQDALGISQVAEVERILAARPPVIVTADTALTPQNLDAKRLVDRTIAQEYQPLASGVLSERTIRAWRLRP